MLGHSDDRIVRRGLDEALACQDMLARAPVRPPLARTAERLDALARRFVRRGRAVRRRLAVIVPFNPHTR